MLADTNQYGATGQPVDEHPAIDRSGQCDQQPDEQRVCKAAVGQYGGSTVLWPDQYRAVAPQYQRLGQPHGKPAHARQPIYQPAECQPVTNVNFSLSVGTVVPRDVHFQPLPAEVVEVMPQYRGYNFIVVREDIVIVEPSTYIIPRRGVSGIAAAA